MKLKLLAVLIVVFILGGCTRETDNKQDNTQSIQNTSSETKDVCEKNHVEIELDKGPEGTFYTVPMYFQQEFQNVSKGALNVARNGNLITCLSMLESYYDSSFITPDVFLKKYTDYISENGEYNAEKLIEAVATNNYRIFQKVPLDAETLPYYVIKCRQQVLVHINHSSMFGDSSSYIIITDITDDGQLMVRDPNKKNIIDFARLEENGETVYRSFDFFLAAGNNATMYLLGGKMDEIPEDEEYEDLENLVPRE